MTFRSRWVISPAGFETLKKKKQIKNFDKENEMKTFLTFLSVALVLTFAVSCSDMESPVSSDATSASTENPAGIGTSNNYKSGGSDQVMSIEYPNGTPLVTDLIGGRNIGLGYIIVTNDDFSCCVEFVTTDGWVMTETHLAIGMSLEDIPQTRSGNPKVGNFPYHHYLDPADDSDEYCFNLADLGYEPGDELYIAAHAVVQHGCWTCIDFEDYAEKEEVSLVETDAGDVNFYMTSTIPLPALNIGDYAELAAIDGSYPVVAEPQTCTANTAEEYMDIVAFTAGRTGGIWDDDVVEDDNGTGAGGKTLTDPQDESQIPLLWHAYTQNQAIVIDLSSIEELNGINFATIDLDHGEHWDFLFFNADNILIHKMVYTQQILGLGDGKAFPVNYANQAVAKVAVFGGMNVGEFDRLGFAVDNVCMETIEEETAWGEGEGFPGRNWAMYFTYTIQD